MSIHQFGGTNAAKTEDYKLRLESLNVEQREEDPKWATPKANLVLVPIFSLMDGMVLFSIFDTCLTQSAAMGIIMAFGVAVVLNVLPLIFAKFLHQAIYRIKRFAGVLAATVLMAFLLMFAATVGLRFAYREMYDEEQQTMQLENMTSNEKEEEYEKGDSEKSLAVVLLLSLSPLVTSVIGFGIAYVSDDEVRRKVEYYERRAVELDEAISDLEAAIETMDNDVERDIRLDEMTMEAAIEEIGARCNILKALSRHYLAEYLAEPSATTKLSQEMLLEQHGNIAEETKYETGKSVAKEEQKSNIEKMNVQVA